MPVEGGGGRYVTLTINHLSAKCVFRSEGVACEFCHTRNITTPCIKTWGRKRQEQLEISISTTIDEAIPSEWVSFLQYVYSDNYEYFAGAAAGRLVKKLAFIFHFCINQLPPREVILKFAGPFLCGGHSYQSSPYVYWRDYRELVTKNQTAFVEADLFAAGLLPALYGFTADQEFYMRFFNTIIEILGEGANHETIVTFPLLHILRDIMMVGSQHQSSDLLLQFCKKSREALEHSGFSQCASFSNNLTGCKSREAALSECLWQCCRLLRRVFRFVLTNESEGRVERSKRLGSVIMDMKTYLESNEVRFVVDRIAARKMTEPIGQKIEAECGTPPHTLLIYRFCQLMVVLLDKPTVLEATTSHEAIAAALSVLEFIRAEFTPSNLYLYYGWRRGAYGILPRVLCMAGLQFSGFPERNVIQSVFSNVPSFWMDHCSD